MLINLRIGLGQRLVRRILCYNMADVTLIALRNPKSRIQILRHLGRVLRDREYVKRSSIRMSIKQQIFHNIGYSTPLWYQPCIDSLDLLNKPYSLVNTDSVVPGILTTTKAGKGTDANILPSRRI